MLIRMFYENQKSYDLLSWVTNVDKFTKVKCNQILMHFGSLCMQQTAYKFEGETQDIRLGLMINQKCIAGRSHYESTAAILVSMLLLR